MSEKLRLLLCHDCESVDELPWYEGPPERDDTLTFRVSQHQFDGIHGHNMDLASVEADDWNIPATRSAIIAKVSQMHHPGEAEGLGAKFYDTKATFTEDAMRCWSKEHGRTRDCADWRSDAKRLYPDTGAERRAEGLSARERPNTFLCDFCPVTSIYSQKRNAARGDYD